MVLQVTELEVQAPFSGEAVMVVALEVRELDMVPVVEHPSTTLD